MLKSCIPSWDYYYYYCYFDLFRSLNFEISIRAGLSISNDKSLYLIFFQKSIKRGVQAINNEKKRVKNNDCNNKIEKKKTNYIRSDFLFFFFFFSTLSISRAKRDTDKHTNFEVFFFLFCCLNDRAFKSFLEIEIFKTKKK